MTRFLQGPALVLAVVVVLNFVLVHAAPGDPVDTIAGASGNLPMTIWGPMSPYAEVYLK